MLSTNRSFTEFFGLLPDQINGRTFADVQPEIDRIFANPSVFAAVVSGTATDTDQLVRGLLTVRWLQPRELQLYFTSVRQNDG